MCNRSQQHNQISNIRYEGRNFIWFNPDGYLQVCLGEIDTESCGMHEIKVPKRFSISQEQMFIDLLNGKECSLLPTIADGLKCQKILDASLLSSENKQWVDLI